MPNLKFEFFESICQELHHRRTCILPNEFIPAERLQELQDEFEEFSPDGAFEKAILWLSDHFGKRDSDLPFAYDLKTREFEATDTAYIDFVVKVSSIRGLGRQSREFEVATCAQLAFRTTGRLYRVGWPRRRLRERAAFNQYLRRLGFNGKIIMGSEKDGGLDILWLPPLGAIPQRPIISVQCKNSSFDFTAADLSHGPATRSLGCHRGLQPNVHFSCVVFNDYIDAPMLGKKPLNYVVLGLSDLASTLRAIPPDYL